MLAACFPLSTGSDGGVAGDSAYERKRPERRQTTWFISLPDENMQFLKEERTPGAIYSIFVKKINYRSAQMNDTAVCETSPAPITCANSTFYTDCRQESTGEVAEAACLQWSLEEVRVLRYGTLDCLVDHLMSDTGDLDSLFVNTFLATYRAFSNTRDVVRTLILRYKSSCEDVALHQVKKEGRKRSVRTLLTMWLELYSDDFRFDSPTFQTLQDVEMFARQYLQHSDVATRCREKLAKFQSHCDHEAALSVDDVSIDMSRLSVSSTALQHSSGADSGFDSTTPAAPRASLNTLTPAAESTDPSSTLDCHYVLESVSCRKFAEQLTAVDAELFRNVVPHQCLGCVWSRRHDNRKSAARVATVSATVRQFNAVSYVVIASIIRHPHQLTLGQRAAAIERWINIAQELRRLKNFSSLKAVISGLQSSAVYRLRRTWALVSRSKFNLFIQLARIFCDDDNQRICREVLYREGTAKHADPNTVRDVCAESSRLVTTTTTAANSCLPLWHANRHDHNTSSTLSDSRTVQGTVPYLGTFLTDLMMIDSALKDWHEADERLVNFDKHRKEFEVLSQIRLLQSAAGLYRIRKDPEFLESLAGITIFDENESYVLSCAIEPESSNNNGTLRHPARRHRRDSSLSYFSSQRHSSVTGGPACVGPVGCWPGQAAGPPDSHSLRSFQETTSYHARAQSLPRPPIRHCSSAGSLRSNAGLASQQSSDAVIARVYLRTRDASFSNQYKSILLSNSDHTSTVLSNALSKYNVENVNTADYKLYQLLTDGTELCLPEDINIFYAVQSSSSASSSAPAAVEFIIRRKNDLRQPQRRPSLKLFTS